MRRPAATSVYYGLEFLLSMPTWVVISIYLVRDLDLSPLELVLMGTAMEAAVFLFEVPTGAVADTYGRKLSLVIGFLGMGTAWLLVGVATEAWVIIVLWAVWGVAYTFTSGAYEAWITDEVGVERIPQVFLRGARIAYAGAFLGLALSVLIGTQSLRAAVIAGGALEIACALACIALMPETGFRRRPREERAGAFADLRSTAVRGGRFVRGAAGAADAARDRVLHRDRERGLRPAQGGALHPRHRASGGRRSRRGRVVRRLHRGRDGVRLLRRRSAATTLRANGNWEHRSAALRLHGDDGGRAARLRADRRGRRCRGLPPDGDARAAGARAALEHLGEPADHRFKHPRDRELDLGPGRRRWPGGR